MHDRLLDALRTVKRFDTVARTLTDATEVRALRRHVAHDDPVVFAILYGIDHLTLDDGTVSLSDIQVEWFDHADDRGRRIYVAPRGSGKSTVNHLLIPLWLAATGRRRFIAAFSDSATQAEMHLSTFKLELARNARLREDYPDLCRGARLPSGASVADRQSMMFTQSGFAFAARGIDGSALGIKLGDQRPDHLLLDDIEPHGSAYSAYQVQKRLGTVVNAVLPMGAENASCTLVGTTTLQGSLIHQAVRHHRDPAAWILDEGFTVHHALPLADGESVWPERWSTDYLDSIKHTASYAMNFLNQPKPISTDYWTDDDFRVGTLPNASRRVLAVDPAVTTKTSSDETGLAVVSFSVANRQACVEHSDGVRMKGEPLRQRVLAICAQFKPDEIVVERNQGGDTLVEAVFHDMPVPVVSVHNTEKKEARFERLLTRYRRGQVLHARRFTELEQAMVEFPFGLFDDRPDAVSIAVDHLGTKKSRRSLASAVR